MSEYHGNVDMALKSVFERAVIKDLPDYVQGVWVRGECQLRINAMSNSEFLSYLSLALENIRFFDSNH